MFYYQCKRCNYISKQKIDMKRHLERKKKCIINDDNKNDNKNDMDLEKQSLIKHYIKDELNYIIKNNFVKNDENIEYKCNICNKIYHNKSNLNKHIKKKLCTDKPIIQQINNIQNIGVQNNIINININSLRGFDEDWNISSITKDMREKILLSDKKFTNTLENIFKNDENLNIILKDKMTGLVYKIKNNEYEAMSVKEIFEETMYKLYKHLKDFFEEIIKDNKNDIRMNILDNEIKEVDKKYDKYINSLIISNDVNKCLSSIIDNKKEDAIQKFIKITSEDDNINVIDY